MKVVGIIAEYNPFHLGHAYQLRYAKETLGADYCVVVMSGPFTQRGTPALFDKYTRASHALTCGADLVLELPVIYATASAEIFATGGVSTLQNTGIVDNLLFGCEADALESFKEIASILIDEPPEYREKLQQALQQGQSFAAARATALCHPEYEALLASPNNILAVEYMKALLRLDSTMEPVCLKRRGCGYHNESLDAPIASATAIRKAILSQDGDISSGNPATILAQHPSEIQENIRQLLDGNEYLSPQDISSMLVYALLSREDFSDIFDCNEDISNKILRIRHLYASFDSYCEELKTKNITHTRISRILCHILLNISKQDLPDRSNGYHPADIVPYLRILGVNERGTRLLSQIKECGSVPLLTTPKDADIILSEAAYHMLQKDVYAADLYRSALSAKTHHLYPTEYTRKFSPQP